MSGERAITILVINIHSVKNAGDAALLEMAVRILRAAFPEARFVLAMNEGDLDLSAPVFAGVRVVPSFQAHASRMGADRRLHWRPEAFVAIVLAGLCQALRYRITRRPPVEIRMAAGELLQAYLDADLVVSCPGNIFATMGKFGLPLLFAAWTVGYGLLLGKPLYVLPQSIGPLRRSWERHLVRFLYARARRVWIREPVSMRLAQAIGLTGATVAACPDVAFALPEAEALSAGLTAAYPLFDSSRPRIGVTVINRLLRHVEAGAWARYEQAVADALSRLVREQGARIFFFPQVTGPAESEDDRVAAVRIRKLMGDPAEVFVIQAPLPPEVLKRLYREMDLFVATRMHSAIFAMSAGVPTLLIEYLHKIRGLAEMIGMQAWVVELEGLEEPVLEAMLAALWQERAAVREQLEGQMAEILARIERVGPAIAEDFDAFSG